MESKEIYQAVFNTALDAIIIVDTEGVIIKSNNQARKLFDYGTEGLEQLSIYHLIPGFQDLGLQIFSTGQTQLSEPLSELRAQKKDGSVFFVVSSINRLLSNKNSKLTMVTVRDMLIEKEGMAELLQKNHLLRLAEKIILMGHWQWDLRTNDVLWSDNLYQVFGQKKGSHITYDIYFSYVHPEDTEYVARSVQKSLDDKKFHNFFHRILLADGTVKTIHLMGQVITDEKGEAIEMVGTCQDVTEQRMAEKKFRGLLESAPDAMVIIDEKGLIQLVNAQTENIFGYTKDEMLGQKPEMLVPERFRPNSTETEPFFSYSLRHHTEGEKHDLWGQRKNGEEFPIEISSSPLEIEEGVLTSVAIRDITARKQAELELEAFNQQLQYKNKELEQFAFIASHDLQEPLGTVISLIDLLERKNAHNLNESGKKDLGYVKQATNRMSELIKGLLDYSRIGRNRVLTKVDCNELLLDIRNDLASHFKETGAKIRMKDLPKIVGCEIELRLLFQNLISNAIKFRKPDTAPVINITAKKIDAFWQFAVQDNGIGISNEHREKIFVIYQRLHNRRLYPGSGIGLAHCRKIVDLHGGKIWVDGDSNNGSTFFFTLDRKIKWKEN